MASERFAHYNWESLGLSGPFEHHSDTPGGAERRVGHETEPFVENVAPKDDRHVHNGRTSPSSTRNRIENVPSPTMFPQKEDMMSPSPPSPTNRVDEFAADGDKQHLLITPPSFGSSNAYPSPPPPPPPPLSMPPASSLSVDTHKDGSPSSFEAPSGFDSDTSDDIFETYNQKFPPLLPTVGFRSVRERRLITHAITNKVVQTEGRVNQDGHLRIPNISRFGGRQPSSAASSSFHQDEDQDEDEIENDENEQIQQLWVEMKEKRKTVARAKIIMAQQRKKMQKLRRKKNDAQVAFMDLVRRMFSRDPGINPSDERLEELYDEMRRLETEYQHLENDYEDLENNLDDEETLLNSFEVSFFSVIAKQHLRASSPPPASEDDNLLRQPEYMSNAPYSLRGISLNGPSEDEHPFWTDLVSAIGDMNLAIEDLSDLNERREVVLHNLRLDPVVGRQVSADDAEFMTDFDHNHESKNKIMEAEMQRVRDLHAKCKRHGVDKKFPSYAIAYALDPSIGGDLYLDDHWPANNTLAHGQFSKLLSSPDHVLRAPHPLTALDELRLTTKWAPNHPEKGTRHVSALKEYGIHQLVYDVGLRDDPTPQYADDPDYVARWLLHQLRTSPLEAHRLADMFRQETGLAIRNYHRWQDDVLHYWWHDGISTVPRRPGTHAVFGDGDFDESFVTHHRRNLSNRSRTCSGASSRREIRSRSASDALPAAHLLIEPPPD